MTADTQPDTTDGVTVCGALDLRRIRTWLDEHKVKYDLTHSGFGAQLKIEIHQITPKARPNKVVGRNGDRLYLDGALLRVLKRTPKKRMPPPGTARGPVRGARRNRSGGVR